MKLVRLLLLITLIIVLAQIIVFPPGYPYFRYFFIPGTISGHGNEIITVGNGLNVTGKITCESGSISVTSYSQWGGIAGDMFVYSLADNAQYDAEFQAMPMHYYYDIRCDGDWTLTIKSSRFTYKVGVM